ncbi:MAG: hypothetical protein ACRBBW_09245 [Cellvibrionaceae bacterium]
MTEALTRLKRDGDSTAGDTAEFTQSLQMKGIWTDIVELSPAILDRA